MKKQIKCSTLFDIAYFKKRWLDRSEYIKQHNYNTITQLISLRSIIIDLSEITESKKHPLLVDDVDFCWTFTFYIEQDMVYGENLKLLYDDIDNVPMLLTPQTMHLDPKLSRKTIVFEELPNEYQ